jgi:adenylate cyclase
MSARIEQHGGRVVDAVGDNLLAEFGSAVEAVQCAMEVQKNLKNKNQELPEEKRLEFRIGINIGDVIQDEDRLFGDGVNVAARIERLSDAGGICISRNTYDHVKNKLNLEFEFLGDHKVKNIKHPVRVYKILMERDLPIPLLDEPLELPDKASIAVLPFDNMSGDTTKEFFSDGLTEEIITGLSKIPGIFVIARNSTFTFKGKPTKTQQICRELGVRYVLEGSVRSADERLRITAQLIDGMTGQHLWAERYDRQMKDIFAIQDDITMKIVVALQVQLTEGEQAHLLSKGIENFEAYIMYLKGYQHLIQFNKEDIIIARHIYQELIKMEPEYATAYVGLAMTYVIPLWFGWEEEPLQALENAIKYTQRCLTLDDMNGYAHAMSGALHNVQQHWEDAIKEGERSMALSPNSADILALYAITLKNVGRLNKALSLIEKAIRLNPMPPEWYLQELATNYRLKGQYDTAISILKKILDRNPDYLMSQVNLTATYSMADRLIQAKLHAKEVLRLSPDFSAGLFMMGFPYKDKGIIDDFIDNLRKAGLPA